MRVDLQMKKREREPESIFVRSNELKINDCTNIFFCINSKVFSF
jgi:hypothetical protein